MGFEKGGVGLSISNMGANSELYERIAEAKKCQGVGYEIDLAVVKAKAETWKDAAELLLGHVAQYGK